jgi:catalase
MLGHLALVDEGLGQRVAEGLGMAGLAAVIEPAVPPPAAVEDSPALSLRRGAVPSIAGRVIGMLVTDGVDAVLLRAIEEAVRGGGARVELVAPTISGIHDSSGKPMKVNHTVEGGPSLLFDAVVLAPATQRSTALARDPAAVDWVRNAFVHLKAIGHSAAAQVLLQAAGLDRVTGDPGLVAVEVVGVEAFVNAAAGHRVWSRETLLRAQNSPR